MQNHVRSLNCGFSSSLPSLILPYFEKHTQMRKMAHTSCVITYSHVMFCVIHGWPVERKALPNSTGIVAHTITKIHRMSDASSDTAQLNANSWQPPHLSDTHRFLRMWRRSRASSNSPGRVAAGTACRVVRSEAVRGPSVPGIFAQVADEEGDEVGAESRLPELRARAAPAQKITR